QSQPRQAALRRLAIAHVWRHDTLRIPPIDWVVIAIESVPRAVASVVPSKSRLMKPRSLPLAVLTQYLAQEIFELHGSLGFFVAVLDDYGSIDRQAPVFCGADADCARAGHDDRAGGDFERLVAVAPVNFAARRVEDRRRACQHHAGGQDRALAD